MDLFHFVIMNLTFFRFRPPPRFQGPADPMHTAHTLGLQHQPREGNQRTAILGYHNYQRELVPLYRHVHAAVPRVSSHTPAPSTLQLGDRAHLWPSEPRGYRLRLPLQGDNGHPRRHRICFDAYIAHYPWRLGGNALRNRHQWAALQLLERILVHHRHVHNCKHCFR